MVLKLYGHPISTCTKGVSTVLREKNVPFELVTIDIFKGEHKSPEVLAKQPFGQIPFIEDEGFILYENRAICRYIAEEYADQGTPELVPTDQRKRALFEQAASIEQANFDSYAAPAVYEMSHKKYLGLEPDVKKYQELEASLARKLDAYEKILTHQKYLAGDEITLADLFHLPHATLLVGVGSKVIEERPNVARWFKELENRPSWQAVKDGVSSTA